MLIISYYLSELQWVLSLSTQNNMFINHVKIDHFCVNLTRIVYILSLLCGLCCVNSLNKWVLLGLRGFNMIIKWVGFGLSHLVKYS